MLYIVKTDGSETKWWTGQKIPDILPARIEYLQADGDELSYIVNLFTDQYGYVTIPHQYGRVVIWYGDMARTIYLNLGR
jgi:hypothetical protein